MVKLVVADDEEKVCRLIIALGEWKKLGIEVVGTASNGIQALDMINREKVDILITDIRMPGCSGLELIEKVRKLSPDIKIMIVSGYANFEYAQNAIKQGCSEYLLKPINKAALNEALAKMVAQIEASRKNNLAFQDFQNERKEEMIKIRNMLIQNLLHDKTLQLTEEVLKKKYYFDARPGIFQVIAVKRDISEGDSSQNATSLIWQKMEEIFLREMTGECYDIIIAASGDYLYGVLNYPARNGEKIRKSVRSCFNQMLGRNDYLGKAKLSLALGNAVKTAE